MKRFLRFSPKQKFYAIICGLTLIGTILLLLPANHFDSGKSICVSVVLFDKQCYACGMTRAIQHLIHLDFKGAYEFNKLAFIVFPLIALILLIELRKLYKKIYVKIS